MSSDNFHLIVQHKKGYWRLATNMTMSLWQEHQNRSDWKRAIRWSKRSPEYDTLDKALDAAYKDGHTEYGEVVIQYEDYYK